MEELGLAYVGDHPTIPKSSFSGEGSRRKTRSQSKSRKIKKINGRLANAAAIFVCSPELKWTFLRDRLDFNDELLAELDVVVASLHVPASGEAENTKRLIRAAENKFVHIYRSPNRPAALGNANVSSQRAGGDLMRVLRLEPGLELNCNPHRF